MLKIKNIERILAVDPLWKPADIAFIKHLEIFASDEVPHSTQITITALCQNRRIVASWPDMTKEFLEIQIQFDNATSLKLKHPGAGMQQIMGFDIIDITDRHWENIAFLIEDYEDGKIEFHCQKVSVLSAFLSGIL